MKTLFYISLFLLVQSCALTSRPVYDLPYSYDKDAPVEWKLGWEHGCKSGFTVYGTNFHRSLYSFTQDVEKMKDTTYYKAWMDSFNYCRHYINRYLAGESFSYKEIPAAISSTNLNISPSGLRDSRALTADGIFTSSNTDQGLFGSVFTMSAPGSGPTGWGKSVDECDWLNRCGDDKPADWHF